MLIALTQQLTAGKSLDSSQVLAAVAELTGAEMATEVKADFLAALAIKGENAEEIAAFARALQAMAIAPPLDAALRSDVILDVCGTGGDRLNTFNISTTVALVMAAAGVRVAKHGNRAVTSQAGSADVLEALGIKIDLTPAEAVASLRERHFAFFFAPHYHPAFRQIAPARRLCGERGQRTIFNFLGPLLNPVRPNAQLVGVPRRELCGPMAEVLQSLGSRSALVVCGSVGDERYLDELSILGKNYVTGFPAALNAVSFDELPLQAATLADLAGADRQTNAKIVHRILHGDERGPKRDAVLMNCAAAMLVAGKCGTMGDGWKLSAEVIDSGSAGKKLKELTGD